MTRVGRRQCADIVKRLAAVLAVGLAPLAHVAAQPPPAVDLGMPGGRYSIAYAVNNAGIAKATALAVQTSSNKSS